MFKPKAIYYEKEILNYPLGKMLLSKYTNTPKYIIENHNNIDLMRAKSNSEFADMKKNLIIGVRKTHRFVPNYKVSNYLVPYTSSGCSAMCMYCYLVCNYNKCAYLRLFVNREEMLSKIIRCANESDHDLVFEIGSNSDLILENTITGNLVWTITEFSKSIRGYLTFPTKFHMVDNLLDLPGKDRVIFRMSLNPQEIIDNVEFKTSKLLDRIDALLKMKKAGYKVGILIAPVILLDNYKKLYEKLFITLNEKIPEDIKDDLFFEVIFMTYSYVHDKINTDAFPNAIKIYDKEKFTSKKIGKYSYKANIKDEASIYIKSLINKYFPNSKIIYIV